jgi:formylglycine-generating enzyme required for sulfatase activity
VIDPGEAVSQEIICSPEFVKRDFPTPDEAFCFVIMPFGVPLLDEIYDEHVKRIIEDAGLECLRGDDIYSINSVMEDIWTLLCRCSVVVGEFTGRNPNVLYEAGIAHTLGKPLVLITQELGDIPFDFKHIRVIEYKNSPTGYADLRNRLKRTVSSVRAERREMWPQSLVDQQQRLQLALQALGEERARTQQLYASIEERHRRQLHYFHQRLAECDVGAEEPAPAPVATCRVERAVVSIDMWDEDQDSVRKGPEVVVGPFEIGRYPVTNKQYEEFVRLTGHYPPEHWGGIDITEQLTDLPVIGVSWNDVLLYCEWLGRTMGREVRLPTEAEWLAAAGYADGRRYPWGKRWRSDACNAAETRRGRQTPVQEFESNGSAPNGCADLLGNVWEWTSSFYHGEDDLPWRAVRGGAYYTSLAKSGSLARLLAYPGHFLFVRDLGFRIVVETPPAKRPSQKSGRSARGT